MSADRTKHRPGALLAGLSLALLALASGPAAPRGGKAKGTAADLAELPALNRKVLEFAREQVGRKVGNGECTTLAVEAFRAAGARLFPQRDRGGDFVWGDPVGSFEDALPGDVLQFRDAVFEGRRTVGKRRWVSWRDDYPHHTAVVAEVRDRGKVVVILHQNTGTATDDEAARRKVKESTLRTDSLRPDGRVWIYRPVAAPGAGAFRGRPGSGFGGFRGGPGEGAAGLPR